MTPELRSILVDMRSVVVAFSGGVVDQIKNFFFAEKRHHPLPITRGTFFNLAKLGKRIVTIRRRFVERLT